MVLVARMCYHIVSNRISEDDVMAWPDFYPVGCPPVDAKPPNVVVYMLVSNPIREDDFLPKVQRHPEGLHNPTPEEYCQACGLSVFENVEDVKELREVVFFFRERSIGRGSLDHSAGVLKPTDSTIGSSHRTWWKDEEFRPNHAFEIIEE